MGYAILRTQKLTHRNSIHRSLKHSFRAQDTPNADPTKTPLNTHLGADSVSEALNNIEARLNTQEKIRKNAVLAIEYLITASPEAMNKKSLEEQNSYFQGTIDWLIKKHGKENIAYIGVHRDEKTPHLYAYVVPIDARGKLNCRSFLGGAKALNEMQTDFAEKVGKQHGLERGIEGSKAKHQRVKQFYTTIEQPTQPNIILPKERLILKKSLFSETVESDEGFARRAAKIVVEAVTPDLEKAALVDTLKRENTTLRKTAHQLEAMAKQGKALTDGLTQEQQRQLKHQAELFRKQETQRLEQEREAQRQARREKSRNRTNRGLER
ncbi:MobV family relaxase [Thiofilum flexile]|uniref:MobV family relaxase n=1 Tax=Thiofilum flexile TaxID=125627 RepID=UPI0003666CB0|nr:MobV family relaxase [Thiofilum flexile]